MVTPLLIIEPNGVYDEVLIRSALDVGAKALDDALGQWVLDWLSSSAGKEGGANAA
jgi:hypothetical protein